MPTFYEAEAAVRAYHQTMKLPLAERPTLVPCRAATVAQIAQRVSELGSEVGELAATIDDLLLARTAMALEELGEWLAAHHRGDLVAAADGWADRAYVLFGDAVTAGLPAGALFQVVHASNMTKKPGPGSKPHKGAGFKRPDIGAALGR